MKVRGNLVVLEVVCVYVLKEERMNERNCRVQDLENRKKVNNFSITGKRGKRNIDFQKTFPSAFNVFPIIIFFFPNTHTDAHVF